MKKQIIIVDIDWQQDFASTAGNLVTLARPSKNLFGTVKISDRKSKVTLPPDIDLSIFS